MIRFICLMAIGCILYGCTIDNVRSVPLPATLCISREFSTESKRLILEAIGEWRTMTNGIARVSPEIGCDGNFKIAPASSLESSKLPPDATVMYGGTDMKSDVVIRILDGLQSDRFRSTVAHELGHAFGLGHENGTLMAAVGDDSIMHVDKVSALRFCEYHGCKLLQVVYHEK